MTLITTLTAAGYETVQSRAGDRPPRRASSIMWLGDSITEQRGRMPHTPNNRATIRLSPAYTNINAGGTFVSITDSGPLAPAGAGTVRYYAADGTMTWQAFGDSEGVRTRITTAGFYTLLSGAGTTATALFVGMTSAGRPVVDKTDTVTVTGSPRLKNNAAADGFMGWTQLLLGNPFSTSMCYAIPTITAAAWWAARAQWQGIYTDITVINLGTNDVNNAATAAQALLDVEAIARLRLAIGSTVVLGCLFPYDARTAEATAAVQTFNRGIRSMGERLNIDVFDSFPYLMNAAGTGAFTTGMARDGLHPSSLGGYMIAAKTLVPILQKYTQPASPFQFAGSAYNATTAPYGNLLVNGQLTGVGGVNGTGSSGELPTSWTMTRTNGAVLTAVCKAPDSASPVLRTDQKQGKYASLVLTNTGGVDGEAMQFRAIATITTNFVAGDYIVFEGDVRISGTGMQYLDAALSASGRFAQGIMSATDAAGAMGDLSGDTVSFPFKSDPMLIEAGVTTLFPIFTMGMKANGVATLDIGQNLTLHKVPAP